MLRSSKRRLQFNMLKVFGPLSRYVPVGLLVLIGGIIHLAWSLFSGPSGVPRGQYIGDTLDIVVVEIILLPLILLQATRRQQSIIAWGVTNITFGIAFGIMLIISAGRFFSGDGNALPTLFLGLIWTPSMEFIPKITPHQKYVTIARLLLSIPCVYFGMKSGDWH
ncbi:MAG: hypothetical protein DME57_10150 [Verrucomicrobia bacterium]|nr:MAG: hypothetical protein DME57_10150 [Verrucomicrobiota bacterium]